MKDRAELLPVRGLHFYGKLRPHFHRRNIHFHASAFHGFIILLEKRLRIIGDFPAVVE